jgi:hypothetical protein
MRKRSLLLSLVTAGTIVAITALVSARKGHAEDDLAWQISQSPSVQLGIREKEGQLEAYEVLFVVMGPDGNERKAHKRVESSRFGYVNFPEEFGGYAPPGSYSWKCIVSNKVVVEGRFEYSRNTLKIDDDAVKFH